MHHAQHFAHRAGHAVPELAASANGQASTNDETRTAPTEPGLSDQQSQRTNSDAALQALQARSDRDPEFEGVEGQKRFATLRSKLALRGFSLHELAGDGYLIARWNLSRHAPDIRAVGAFLRQIGGVA